MAKTLLYRFFKVGRLPVSLEPKISKEKVLDRQEGMPALIHYHDFEAQGKKFHSKIVKAVGAFCLTEWGIYSSIFRSVAIQFSWADPRVKEIQFEVKKKYLSMSFEASVFDPSAKGKVDYQYKCKNPEEVLAKIKAR